MPSLQRSPPLADTLAVASRAVARVLGGASLSALPAEDGAGATFRPAVQDLCYGTLRDYGAPQDILRALADKPLRDRTVRALLLCSLFELRHARRAAHIVVDEAVSAAGLLGRAAAGGFVNAVLRNYLRRRESLEAAAMQSDVGRYGHPQWWIARVQRAYPGPWREALAAGNMHPPMTLRVNRRKITPAAYRAKLAAEGIAAQHIGPAAWRLETPRHVDTLPGFAAGEVSVQDAGAQLAAPLLDLRDNMRVLDACAAPGGKTGHILELADVELVAIDRDAARLARIVATTERLGLRADVRCADAGAPDAWWDGRAFDRILMDAPCSGSGVARRHPDMKWLRRETDLAGYAREQLRLLSAVWRLLAPNGKLLYATCSVFPEENGAVIQAFTARCPEATRLPIADLGDGQVLPDTERDGFYYAVLQKRR